MHEVLHAPGLPQAHSAVEDAHHHSVHDLFGAHSALECLALDQLSHGHDGPTPQVPHWHTWPSIAPVGSAAAEHLPTPLAPFQARAPPRVNA